MKYPAFYGVLGLIWSAQTCFAADKVEAAVGGGVGGAVGAVVGEELGGRTGAIIGAGVGAAVGVAVATDNNRDDNSNAAVEVIVSSTDVHPKGRHCPPGQAKKGRC